MTAPLSVPVEAVAVVAAVVAAVRQQVHPGAQVVDLHQVVSPVVAEGDGAQPRVRLAAGEGRVAVADVSHAAPSARNSNSKPQVLAECRSLTVEVRRSASVRVLHLLILLIGLMLTRQVWSR